VIGCDLDTLRAVRLGPVHSSPGGWHYFMSSSLLGSLVHPGDRIVAFAGRAVDPEGTPIGYPPIHMHHVHLVRVNKHSDDHHYFQTHGDFSTGPSWGLGAPSAAGYIRRLPSGFAVFAGSDGVYLSTVVNDVRAASAGAAEWFLELAVELAPRGEPRQAAHLIWFKPPPSHYLPDDVYRRYAVPNWPSLSWWYHSMPVFGEMLPGAWLHTHRARYKTVMLVASSPARLGLLNCSLWGIRPIRGERASAADPEDVMGAIRRRGRVVCEEGAEEASSMLVEEGDLAARQAHVRPGHYERAGHLVCRKWSFEQGDPATFVAFHEPRWQPEVREFPMHTNLFFYARLSPDSSYGDAPRDQMVLPVGDFNPCA